MKMRELEKRTGVHRETIRVYLRHGVVPEPERPRRNVAHYDENHVRAIKAVRDLQKNNALTLGQIKKVLEGSDSGRQIEAGAFQNLETLVAARVGFDQRQIALSSLCDAYPHAEEDARTFAKMGLVEIAENGGKSYLSVTDSRLVTIWGEMRAAGYTEDLDFSPEILSFYKEPAVAVARQESRLFLERTSGKIDEENAAAMFQSGIRLMIDFFNLLRTKALLEFLHEEAPSIQAIPRSANENGPPK